MDLITPCLVSASELLNETKCDGIELTKNLFKDHKMSIDYNKKQKLDTYLRIRSLTDLEAKDRKHCYQVIDSQNLLVIPPKGSNAFKFGSDSERKKFNFTKIFEENADQSVVYDFCALPVVRRFLSGQNGLLFAYGITSSGKSYTMRGTTLKPGIIPRTLKTLFEVIGAKIVRAVPQLKPNTFTECSLLSPEEQSLEEEVRNFIFTQSDESYEMKVKMDSFRSQISVINEKSDDSLLWDDVLHSTFRTNESNIKCCLWISFYEIYNENIYDLLELVITGEKKQKIMLLKDESGNYYVKGLRQIFVRSAEEAYKVLLFGQNNLHISATNLNKNSSRSHCAFTITLVTTNSNNFIKRPTLNINHLSICDLAGAERSDKANNFGDRIKEAGKINGSLLSLSRCISTIRHNQKNDSSKQRIVNYRDSKLTKVFQPFLNGNGTVAMISTMNPFPNLFDETYFALKFTGVASQVVVSTEEQRNKFHDSLKRLTQIWMQSSERWSNFALLKPKPSISIIQTIQEEEEESESDECHDMTVDEIERRVEEITQMDLSRADPQEIEVLRTQIEFLVDKLNRAETDKFEMEIEVRKQVVSEFNKLFKDMQEMAANKDRAKKELEDMMAQRLLAAEELHKQEKLMLESKLNSIENDNFRVVEELNSQLCQLKVEKEQNDTTIQQKEDTINRLTSQLDELKRQTYNDIQQKEENINKLNSDLCQLREDIEKNIEENKKINDLIQEKETLIQQKDNNIKELESEIESYLKNIESQSIIKRNVFTSPLKLKLKNSSTSPMTIKLMDANVSAINLIESMDANTSTADITSSVKEVNDKSVGNSLPEMIDKNTSISIELNNKSMITDMKTEDKETETEFDVTLVNKSVSMTPLKQKNVITSPLVFEQKCIEITEQKYNELLETIQKYENEVKERNAKIRYHQTSEIQSIQKIKELEDENKRLEEKLKSKENFSDFSLKHFHNALKTKHRTDADSSSVSSFSSKTEDTYSVMSTDSMIACDKTKKSIKSSVRKRKPNIENSTEKHYLISVNDTLDTTIEEKLSQNSECADEVGNEVFSTKKRSHRKVKRKVKSQENEDYNCKPMSKRKRLPLQNLCCSPVSPIIASSERVTRSKARKCIEF